MKNTNKIYSSDIWKIIPTLIRKSRTKNYVAVGYLGSNAQSLLPLKKGDLLTVDCSLFAIKSGQTNPKEVALYLKKGVKVYSKENLHAKIYVLNNSLIIGSNNVSINSKDRLFEAAVLISDKKLINNAINFIKDIDAEILTPKYVKSLYGFYPKERKYGLSSKDNIKQENKNASILFLESIIDAKWDEQDDKVYESRKKVLKTKLVNKSKYEVHSMKIEGTPKSKVKMKPGDWMIELYEYSNKIDVYPPSRILELKEYIKKGKINTQVLWEAERNPNILSWREFKKHLNQIGISTKKHIYSRQIKDSVKKKALFRIWDDK